MCHVANKGVGAELKGVYEPHYKHVSNLAFCCEARRHTREVSKNSGVIQRKFRVMGVECNRGVKELKGRTTQVMYGGYWTQELGIGELKSHTTHIVGGG